jgi:hypothetical protein
MAGCGGISFSDFSSAVASSFETPRKSAAPQDEVNQKDEVNQISW